jgi:serine/threonine protein kinase
MSPEQARGDRNLGPASDVYALGVIFYELLCGERPYEGDSVLQILHRILTQPPIPLEQRAAGLSNAVYAIANRAMAREARDRFRDVAEFARALQPFVARERSDSTPSEQMTRAETAVGATGRAESPPATTPTSVVGVQAGSVHPGRVRGVLGGLVIGGAFALIGATVTWRAARAPRTSDSTGMVVSVGLAPAASSAPTLAIEPVPSGAPVESSAKQTPLGQRTPSGQSETAPSAVYTRKAAVQPTGARAANSREGGPSNAPKPPPSAESSSVLGQSWSGQPAPPTPSASVPLRTADPDPLNLPFK